MSTYLGKQLLSGVGTNTIANAHSLFDFKWTDHILNEMSWLRSDTYSWHNGDVYVAAYNHLENDLENYVSAETDIIDGIEIWYVVSPDGHKIIDAGYPDQEHRTLAAEQLYNKTGVSWYYIIDRVNKRFKLPRENPAREELIQTIGIHGNDMSIGVTDGTDNAGLCSYSGSPDRVMAAMSDYGKNVGESHTSSTNLNKVIGLTKDASKSGMIADLSNTESIYSGNKYLYFYVGDYDVSDIKGINLENRNAITNCLTEIPQDIKLELNADKTQLTVKSGSVMYYPDGFETDGTTKKFGKIVLENDVQISSLHTADSDSVLVYRYKRANPWFFANMPNSASGDTHPGPQYEWYDTVNNFEGWTGNTTSGTIVDDERATFPLALLHWNNDNTIEIKHVFNGFGYIGSTMFILPGVKCLIPNGRKSDGTLKNIEAENKSVLTRTTNSNQTGLYHFGLSYTNTIGMVFDNYYEYNKTNNRNYASGDLWLTVPFASMILTNGVISNFNPKTTFHALDYSDIPEVTKNILEILYPVGGVYIGTQAECPMTLLMPGTTWTLVSSGKALWTSDGTNANTTIDAGLPNITGYVGLRNTADYGMSGAFKSESVTEQSHIACALGASTNKYTKAQFSAARSSSIYGNSTTVQPPAYVVNVWRRTA